MWGDRTRLRVRGGGGDRRALGRGPGADPVAQTTLDMPRTHLPDRDLHRAAQSQDSAHWPYVDLMDTLIMA